MLEVEPVETVHSGHQNHHRIVSLLRNLDTQHWGLGEFVSDVVVCQRSVQAHFAQLKDVVVGPPGRKRRNFVNKPVNLRLSALTNK